MPADIQPTEISEAIECMLDITDVKGGSAIAGFEDQIDIVKWNWAMTQSGTAHLGTGSGAGRVSVQDITLTKFVDSATHALMRACCNGKHFPKAVLTVRKAGGEPMPYLVITMEQVMVTSVMSGSKTFKSQQIEDISLNFAKVTVDYTPQTEKGASGAKKTMKYDIAKNVAE